MPDINVVCFSHVGITVSDLEVSAFYDDLFGFKVLFDHVYGNWRRVGLRVGDVQLELFSPFPGRTGAEALTRITRWNFGRPRSPSPSQTSMRPTIGWLPRG